MTGPAVTQIVKSPLFVVALRHERDCWNVLVMHTLRCPACHASQQECGQHGFACNTGLTIRDEWLSAARRRYELSPVKRQEG